MHSVRFLFLPMVLSLLLSGCAQTRETSSTIFAMNTVMELTAYGDSGQQVLDQAAQECQTMKQAARSHLEQAAELIVEKVVNG